MSIPLRIRDLMAYPLCLGVLLFAGCGSSDEGEKMPVTPENSRETSSPAQPSLPPVQTEPFGKTSDGREITKFILSNNNGMSVSVINYGAIVTEVNVPDRDGNGGNVVLGFDNLKGYEGDDPYFGAICGRYSNRIAGGKFTLDGTEYQLATNNGPNHLHGGNNGFNEAVWSAESFSGEDFVGVKLDYVSPDGEENYPGELRVTVKYTLTNYNELTINYTAHSTKPTHINLTNHTYWNLAGGGDVLQHELTLYCDSYLPVDETLIPTGELKPVEGTPMDFRTPQAIGSRLDQVKGEDENGGYDHCYVINKHEMTPSPAAGIYEPKSGRVLNIFTTEPGIQFYTGNFLDGSPENGGYKQHAGFCLECQHFPDSPNRPEFPSTLLEPGVIYTQETIHKFSVRE